MVGSLFQHEDIDAVIVGADRVVKNGDTANKVGFRASPPNQNHYSYIAVRSLCRLARIKQLPSRNCTVFPSW